MSERTLAQISFHLKKRNIVGFFFDGSSFLPYLAGEDFKPLRESAPSGYLFFPPFVNHHLHAFDLPLLASELPGAPDGAVSPHGSVKIRYLRGLTEEEMKENALSLLVEMILRGTTSAWVFAEEGIKGLRAAKGAISSLKGSLPGALGSSLSIRILSRPAGRDDEEWEELLDASDGFGLSAFRDDVDGIYPDIIRLARRRKKEVVVHFSEAVREDVNLIRRNKPTALVHLLRSTEDDLRAIRELEIPVIFTPMANRHFGLSPPVGAAHRLGLRWYLGSDNGMLSPPDMLLNCAEASYLLGGGSSETGRAIVASVGEVKNLLSIFQLPVRVREVAPSPRLLLSLRFLGYAVMGEGVYLIRNTPPLLQGGSSEAPR